MQFAPANRDGEPAEKNFLGELAQNAAGLVRRCCLRHQDRFSSAGATPAKANPRIGESISLERDRLRIDRIELPEDSAFQLWLLQVVIIRIREHGDAGEGCDTLFFFPAI